FRDYNGAIQDFELLDSLSKYDIGFSANGDYHLNIAKAICYSGLDQNQKAIEIIEKQLKVENFSPGNYDYYQLGATYFKLNNLDAALKAFLKQTEISELAENEYYLAKIYKLQNNLSEYQKHKEKALELYKGDTRLIDPYTHHFNKVYLRTIEEV
ncbi:MAG: tetratricopeptide repeat protein, partial [Leadbetterella sp.]